ncbi:MAG: hypothetical protein KIS62_06165 [Ramlibacter sp.]|nr:hypothetical protein [Ramlibacter sp.]
MKSVKVIWASVLSSVVLVAGLAACGGSSDPVLVASSDVKASLTASNGGALVDTTLSFPNGVADFGTTSTTTLSIGGSATSSTQTATISAGGQTATGDMGYGSCVFIIKTSDFAPDSALGTGKKVTVTPCEVTVTTKGIVANGGQALTKVNMTLGSTEGTGQVRVNITADGAVKVGSSSFANIILIPTTGGGS